MPSLVTLIVGSLVLSLGASAGMTLSRRGTRTREVFSILFVFFYLWAVVMALFA